MIYMKTKIKIKIKYILNNNLYFKYLIIFLNVYPIVNLFD